MTDQSLTLADFPSLDAIGAMWGRGFSSVRHWQKGHGSQILLTDDAGGQWVLKRARGEECVAEHLDAILRALVALQAAGSLPLVPPMQPLADGRLACEHEGHTYYMLRLLGGVRPNFGRVQDVEIVLRAQAQLHMAGFGPAPELARTLGVPLHVPVRRIVEERLGDMQRLGQRLDAAPDTAFHNFLRRRHVTFQRLADLAVERLTAGNGNLEATVGPCTIIHGDAHENNYLIPGRRGEKSIWLLDLESTRVEPAVIDLVVPLQYLGLRSGWNEERLARAIRAYESIRPLSSPERALLHFHLIFPVQWNRALRRALRLTGPREISTWQKIYLTLRAAGGSRRFAERVIREPGWPG